MPLLVAIIGIALLASALNGRSGYLLQTVQGEFTGQPNALIWLGSLGIVGAIGYIPGLRTIANWFLALILVSMFLANNRGTSGGFFAQFNKALGSTAQSATQPSASYNSVPGAFGDIPTVESPVYPSLPTPQPFTSALVF